MRLASKLSTSEQCANFFDRLPRALEMRIVPNGGKNAELRVAPLGELGDHVRFDVEVPHPRQPAAWTRGRSLASRRNEPRRRFPVPRRCPSRRTESPGTHAGTARCLFGFSACTTIRRSLMSELMSTNPKGHESKRERRRKGLSDGQPKLRNGENGRALELRDHGIPDATRQRVGAEQYGCRRSRELALVLKAALLLSQRCRCATAAPDLQY